MGRTFQSPDSVVSSGRIRRGKRTSGQRNVTVVNGTATPRQAAEKFVEKHVRFDPKAGLPVLKSSAPRGLAKAAREVGIAPRSVTSTLKEIRSTPERKPAPKERKAGPQLREANVSTQRRVVNRQRSEAQTAIRKLFKETPEEERPLLKDQLRVARAEAAVNLQSARKPWKTTGESKKERKLKKARVRVKAEINRQAELGNTVHPNMPSDIIGDLIPDTPGEIASLPIIPLRGAVAAKTVGQAATAARTASQAGQGAKAAATAAAQATKTGRAFSKIRRFSRSPKGRGTKAAVGGAALGAGAATGTLGPAVAGTAKGAWENPLATLKTTGRGLASIPAAGIGAAAALGMTGHRLLETGSKPGKQGSIEHALQPVKRFGEEALDEAKKQFETYTSKDADRIAKATAEDYGLLPAIGGAAIARHFTTPAVRHAAAKAKGVDVPKGEPAPPLFPRWEDRLGVRMKAQAARAQGEEARIKARLGQEASKQQRRLNTRYKGSTKAGAILTMASRSKHSKKMEEFADETGKQITLDDLTNRAAENPLFNYRDSDEARAAAEEGLARSTPGTAEHTYYRAIAHVADVYDEPQFAKTVAAKREALTAITRSEDLPYFSVYEEEAKRTAGQQDESKYREFGERGAEMMRVEDLVPLREWDRERTPKGDLDRLERDVRKEGIETPLVLEFDPESGTVLLGEGNNRLAVAQRLGLTEVPVRVVRKGGRGSSPRQKGARAPQRVAEPTDEYVPGDLLPSAIGLPSRKLRTGGPKAVPVRPSGAVPVTARSATDAKTREEAVGAGTKESYHASEIARERKELRKELAKKEPDPHKVLRLRGRIAAKAETMGPVKLSKNETRAVLASLGPDADGAEKRAALQLAQAEKKRARDEAQMPALRQEFREGAEEILKKYGQEGETPAYFPHHDPTRLEAPPPAPPFARAGVTQDKERMLGPGSIEAQGAVDYGAHQFASAISGAARRKAQEGFGAWLREAITQTHDIGRGPQRVFNKAELGRMAQTGVFDPNTHYRVHAAFFDNPDRVKEGDLEAVEGVKNSDKRQAELSERAQKIEQEGGGDTYYIVPRNEMDAYLQSQKIMGKWGQRLQTLGIVESRALLATSFAWMTAQVVAESGLLMGTQSPYRLARALPHLIRIRKEKGDAARHLALISDTAYGTDPIFGKQGAKSYQEGVAKGFDEAQKLPINNYMRKLVTFEYPGEWDRFKGGFLRDWYTLSEMDRQFNSRARNWARGMGESWTAIDDISHRMKGLTPEEQIRFLDSPEGRAATEAFMQSIDRALGNWTAMSPAERVASHVLIFYPFLRFSLDWALRTYPADHPVRYTIATSMGQWNAEQLEDFLTKQPSFFTDWLQAPIYGSDEDHPTGFMSFSRVAPGSNALIESLGSNRGLWGAITGAMRPTIGTTLRGISKYNEFGEYDEKTNIAEAFKNAAINLTFPGRAIQQYVDPSQSPGRPGRTEYALRSGVLPFYPEDFPSAKKKAIASELWNQVNKGTDQAMRPYPDHLDVDKYGKWFEDDQSEMKARGLSAALNEPKDIERYLRIGVTKNHPKREEYKEYLTAKLDKANGAKQVEKAKRRLVTLYGREGKELTPTLQKFYDEGGMDTGRSGPRFQREVGSKKAAEAVGPGPPFKRDLLKDVEAKQVATRKKAKLPPKEVDQKAAKVNVKVAEKIGDERLTPEMVGEFARASKVTGIPASILAGIHRIEQGFGTVDSGGDAQTRTSSDGTFLSSYNIMADAWGPGRQLDRGAKALGYKKQLDPTNFGDGAIAAGIVLLNNGWKQNPEGAMRAYSGGGYGTEVAQGLELIDRAKGVGVGVAAVPKVKNPNKRPFKGLVPVKGFDLSVGMSEAKWDSDNDAHGATVLNKAINPIVKAFVKRYPMTVGEGYAPPPSDHRSAEHLETGTATDVYPEGNDWGDPKAMAKFNQGLKVLTAAGVQVLYDGQHGTTPYPNHGEGNHAHIKWLGADGSGAEALQKLTGMTNQEIANVKFSVGSGGATSYSGGGSGGGASTGVSSAGGGGGSSSSSFTPEDYSKTSAIEGLTDSLPSIGETPSVFDVLPDLRKKRKVNA